MTTMCECGHGKERHQDGRGICLDCPCNLFRARAPHWSDPKLAEPDGGYLGALLDDDQRRQLAHIPIDFALAMGAIFERGAQGVHPGGQPREPMDWQHIEGEELRGKLRSLMRHAANGEYDAAACNCLILWWHSQRERACADD